MLTRRPCWPPIQRRMDQCRCEFGRRRSKCLGSRVLRGSLGSSRRSPSYCCSGSMSSRCPMDSSRWLLPQDANSRGSIQRSSRQHSPRRSCTRYRLCQRQSRLASTNLRSQHQKRSARVRMPQLPQRLSTLRYFARKAPRTRGVDQFD